MKRSICLLTLLPALPLFAQTLDIAEVSLADLDFSEATVSQAGPDSLYIRSVQTDQGVFSFVLQPVEPGGLTVTRIVAEDENLLPPSTILDFATITPDTDGTIRIDGVIIDGTFYSGALAVDDGGRITLSTMLTRAADPQIRNARLQAVEALLDAPTEEEFEARLAQEQARLETLIEEIRAERDALAAENEALRVARDALEQRLEDELANQPGVVPAVPEPESVESTTEITVPSGPSRSEFDSLSAERDALQAEVVALQEQIAALQDDNATLQEDLTVMTAEVDRLQTLVEQAALETPVPEWEFPGDYVRTADLRAATAAVANEIAVLSEQIRSLEREVARVADSPALTEKPAEQVAEQLSGRPTEPTSPATTEPSVVVETPATRDEAEDAVRDAERAERIARLQGAVAALEAENAALRRDRDALEQRILDEILGNSLVAMMRERMDDVAVSGFAAAVPDTGSWNISETGAVQLDENAFFAKAAFPVEQERDPVLYSVQVRSLDDGWVGVGLHLFVSDVTSRRGYGMGSSLLVWLTRDPDIRGTAQTYLQVYRSDDDVNMERVLDAAVPEAVASFLDLQILYEPETQYITVAINGEDKVRYRTWFGIDTGVEVALRSLGRAEFRDFEVLRATGR